MAQIVLDRLTKRWGPFQAVQECSFEVADGEFVVLLGPSGCGKTTMMRMIAGLEEPTGGKVTIGERDVTYAAPKHRDVAMVFQNYSLYPQLSVYDNIRFPLRARRVPANQHEGLIHKAARMVELDQLLHRKPRQLSGGQRQRVALARAIVRSPQVFLMDEPLSNLDAQLRVSMRSQLKHLHHELRTTTIYVTHDQVEAMTLADRIVVMRNGAIQQIGSPREIYGRPANTFVASFIGSPAMNLVPGQTEDGHFVADGVRLALPGSPDHKEVTVGVRPEDLSPADPQTAPISGTIYSVEATGDATLVTVQCGAGMLIARLDKSLQPAIDERIGLVPAPNSLHLFSHETGLRI